MASAFNLTAQINLRGPTNLKPIVADIKRELGSVSANVQIKLDARSARSIDTVTNRLQAMNNVLTQVNTNARNLNATLSGLSAALGTIRQSSSGAATGVGRVSQNMQQTSKNIKVARTEMEEFGKQSFLAIKRFAAFTVVTTGVFALTNAITSGFRAFIQFDKELVKLQQVTGKGTIGISSLEKEITRLATTLGVSSESLASVASTLAQAGLSAEDTRIALSALAKTELAPSFDNITDTTEGAIAALRQFELQAGELEGALGSINAVAAAFAVESKDIIAAIQRTGGVFAAASKGVSEGTDALNEFIAIFTSVRQTTRESAETISTGLRTIFTRIQRSSTVDLLKDYGVELRNLEGKFVGPFEAVKRLSAALSSIDPRSASFSKIVEELGGFRQVGKVIPLIQQFAVAQQALAVAQKGQGSLTDAQIIAQKSLANQIAKVREQFLALIRDIGKSTVFQGLFKIVTGLASSLIGLASAFKPILPILAIFGAIKGVSAVTQFASGFASSFSRGGGSKAAGQSIGSGVTGGRERERTEATTRAADAIRLNTDALRGLTTAVNSLETTIRSRGSATLASGGKVLGFNKGGLVPGYGGGDKVPAFLEGGEVVLNKQAVRKYGADNLLRMNKYDDGGFVVKQKIGKLGSNLKYGQIPNFTLQDAKGQVESKLIPKPIELTSQDFAWMVNSIREEYKKNKKEFSRLKEESATTPSGQTVRASDFFKFKGLNIDENKEILDPWMGLPALNRASWSKGKAFEDFLEYKYPVKKTSISSSNNTDFQKIIDDHYSALDFETGDAKFKKIADAVYTKSSPRNNSDQMEILSKRFRAEQDTLPWTPKIDSFIGPDQLNSTEIYYPKNSKKTKEDFDKYYQEQYELEAEKIAKFLSINETTEAARRLQASYSNGGKAQKFVGGSPGGVKPKLGARYSFRDLDSTELKQLSTEQLLEYARAQMDAIMTTGGAGIAVGHEFVEVPQERIIPELEQYLISKDGKRGFLREKEAMIGKAIESKARDGVARRMDSRTLRKMVATAGGVDSSALKDVNIETLLQYAEQAPRAPKAVLEATIARYEKDPGIEGGFLKRFEQAAKNKEFISGKPLLDKIPDIPERLIAFRKSLEKELSEVQDEEFKKGIVDKIVKTSNAIQEAKDYQRGVLPTVTGRASHFAWAMRQAIPESKNFANGGLVQKFANGSVGGVETPATPASQDILDKLKKLGGNTGIVSYYPSPTDKEEVKSAGESLRAAVSEAVKTSGLTAKQLFDARVLGARPDGSKFEPALMKVLEAAEAVKKAKQQRKADQIARNMQAAGGGAYQFGLASIYGPNGELGFDSLTDAKEIEGKDGQKYLTQIVRKSLPTRYRKAVTSLQQDIAGISARGAAAFQYVDIFGDDSEDENKVKRWAFDLDETLLSGADIPGKKISDYNDPTKVKAALDAPQVRLTSLGEELAIRLIKDRSLMSRIRVLTARPPSNEPLLASKLSSLGLPIPEGKITGVSGAENKIAALAPDEMLVDDKIETIEALQALGRKAYLYSEPRGMNPNNLSSRKAQASMEGYGLEEIIRDLGVNISEDDADPNRPIDYAKGLGSRANIWGFKPNMPVDTKRTNSSDAVRRLFQEAQEYYIQNFARGGKARPDYFSLEKDSGFGAREFNMLVDFAKTNDFTLDEFRAYLTQELKQKKAKADLRVNPYDVLRAITPSATRTSTPEQIALAKDLMGPTDAKYKQELDRAFKPFARGGSNGEHINARVSNGEAFIPPDLVNKIGESRLDKLNRADTNGMAKFSSGGISIFKGPGSGTSDSIKTKLPVGSYILRRRATEALGLYKNGGSVGGIQKFSTGGSPAADLIIRLKEERETKNKELEELKKQASGATGSSRILIESKIKDTEKELQDLTSSISKTVNQFDTLSSTVDVASKAAQQREKKLSEAQAALVNRVREEAKKAGVDFDSLSDKDKEVIIESARTNTFSMGGTPVDFSDQNKAIDTAQRRLDRANKVKEQAERKRDNKFGSATSTSDVRAMSLTPQERQQQRKSDTDYLDYKARKEGVSADSFRYGLAQRLGKTAYETQEMYGGRKEEMKQELVMRQRSLAGIGTTIEELTDKGEGGRTAAENTQLADAQSRLAAEAEKIANDMKALNPTLDMDKVTAASREIASALASGDLASAQAKLVETLGKAPEDVDAMRIAMQKLAEETGIGVDVLEREFSSGKGSQLIKNQQFIQSREGQRFGALAELMPNFAEIFSKTRLGKTFGAGADFISGKGGKFSKLFAGAGGFTGIGATLAGGVEGLKTFLSPTTLKDPSVAGALGAVGGAGVGAATGAQIGAFAGPIGALIGGVGGAIIGGIDGWFSAKNQAILTNALDNLANTSGNLDNAFKKLDVEANKVNFTSAQKAFGEVLASGKSVSNIALSAKPSITGSAKSGAAMGSAAAGALTGAAVGSFIPVAGTLVGAGVGGALGYAAGAYANYRSSAADKKEAFNTFAQQSSKNLESATKLADFANSKKSVAELSQSLNDLKNGNLGASDIIKMYADSIRKHTGASEEAAQKEAEETVLIQAYVAAMEQRGLKELAQQELENNKNKLTEKMSNTSKEYIVTQETIAKTNKILAKTSRDVVIATENLFDIYKKITAYAQKVSDSINDVFNKIQNRVDALTGNAKLADVDRSGPERILNNITAFSQEQVEAANSQVTKLFGNTPELQQVANQANAAKFLQEELPKILRDPNILNDNKRKRVNSLEDILKNRFNVGDEAVKQIMEQINNALDKGGADSQELADKISKGDIGVVSDAAQKAQETQANLAKTYSDILQTTIDRQNQYNQLISKASENERKASDIRLTSSMNLAKALGRDISLADMNKPFDTRVRSLTSGLIDGGTTDPNQIAESIIRLEQNNQKLIERNQAIPPGSAEFIKNQKTINDNNRAINNGTQALEELADRADKADNALSKIQQRVEQGKAFGSFIDNLRGMNPEQSFDFMRQMNAFKVGRAALEKNENIFSDSRFNQMFVGGLKTLRDSGLLGADEAADMFKKFRLAEFETMGLRSDTVLRTDKNGQKITVGDYVNAEAGAIGEEDPFLKAYKKAVQDQIDANTNLAKLTKDAASKIETGLNLVFKRLNEELPRAIKEGLADIVVGAGGAASGGMIGGDSQIGSKGELVHMKPQGTDKYPYMLSKGEAVINAATTKKNPGIVSALLNNKVIEPNYAADGAMVGMYPTAGGGRTDNIAEADQSKFDVEDLKRLANDPNPIAGIARQAAQTRLSSMGIDWKSTGAAPVTTKGPELPSEAPAELKPDTTIEADRQKLREEINAQGAAYAAGTSEEAKKDKAELEALNASLDSAKIRAFYFNNSRLAHDSRSLAESFINSPYGGARIENWDSISLEEQEKIIQGYSDKFQQIHKEVSAKLGGRVTDYGWADSSEVQQMRQEANESLRGIASEISDKEETIRRRGQEDTRYNPLTGKNEGVGTYYNSEMTPAQVTKQGELNARSQLESDRQIISGEKKAVDDKGRLIIGSGDVQFVEWANPGEKAAGAAARRAKALENVNRERVSRGLPPLELPQDQIDPELAAKKAMRAQELAANREAYLQRREEKKARYGSLRSTYVAPTRSADPATQRQAELDRRASQYAADKEAKKQAFLKANPAYARKIEKQKEREESRRNAVNSDPASRARREAIANRESDKRRGLALLAKYGDSYSGADEDELSDNEKRLLENARTQKETNAEAEYNKKRAENNARIMEEQMAPWKRGTPVEMLDRKEKLRRDRSIVQTELDESGYVVPHSLDRGFPVSDEDRFKIMTADDLEDKISSTAHQRLRESIGDELYFEYLETNWRQTQNAIKAGRDTKMPIDATEDREIGEANRNQLGRVRDAQRPIEHEIYDLEYKELDEGLTELETNRLRQLEEEREKLSKLYDDINDRTFIGSQDVVELTIPANLSPEKLKQFEEIDNRYKAYTKEAYDKAVAEAQKNVDNPGFAAAELYAEEQMAAKAAKEAAIQEDNKARFARKKAEEVQAQADREARGMVGKGIEGVGNFANQAASAVFGGISTYQRLTNTNKPTPPSDWSGLEAYSSRVEDNSFNKLDNERLPILARTDVNPYSTRDVVLDDSVKAFGIGAGKSVIPSMIGLAAAAPFTGGGTLPLLAAVAAGAIAGTAGSLIQEDILNNLAPESNKEMNRLTSENPLASAAGGMATGFGIGTARQGAQSFAGTIGQRFMGGTFSAGVGAATEAGTSLATGQEIDPESMLRNAAMNFGSGAAQPGTGAAQPGTGATRPVSSPTNTVRSPNPLRRNAAFARLTASKLRRLDTDVYKKDIRPEKYIELEAFLPEPKPKLPRTEGAKGTSEAPSQSTQEAYIRAQKIQELMQKNRYSLQEALADLQEQTTTKPNTSASTRRPKLSDMDSVTAKPRSIYGDEDTVIPGLNKYRFEGVDSKTGYMTSKVIEAMSDIEAQAKVREMGIKLTKLEKHKPAESLLGEGYSRGGMVTRNNGIHMPWLNNGDNMLATLRTGEGVVSAPAYAKYGTLVDAINRSKGGPLNIPGFADGTDNGGPTKSVTGPLGSVMDIGLNIDAKEFMGTFVADLNDFGTNFNSYIEKLSKIKLPDRIEMVGKHTVEVSVNGAAAFESIEVGMRNLINTELGKKMNMLWVQSEGKLGEPEPPMIA